MASMSWPARLPKTLLMEGLSVTRDSGVIRTQMDAGPKKARRRYTASTKTFSGMLLLTAEQRAVLDDFYHFDLADGVLRFNFADPQTLETAEFRFAEDYIENSVGGMFEALVSLERMS